IVTAQDGDGQKITGTAIWRSDGTTSGTKKIGFIPTPKYNSKPPAVAAIVADTRIFAIATPEYSYDPVELWSGDGTSAGFKRTAHMGSLAGPPLGVDGKLYFVAKDASVGWQLWVSDGTPTGTRILARGLQCSPADSCGSLLPIALFRLGSTAY